MHYPAGRSITGEELCCLCNEILKGLIILISIQPFWLFQRNPNFHFLSSQHGPYKNVLSKWWIAGCSEWLKLPIDKFNIQAIWIRYPESVLTADTAIVQLNQAGQEIKLSVHFISCCTFTFYLPSLVYYINQSLHHQATQLTFFPYGGSTLFLASLDFWRIL